MSEQNSVYEVGKIYDLKIDALKSNPEQVRKYFDNDSIAALADSIEEDGLLQNISFTEKDGELIIVAGERRFKALKLLKEQGKAVPPLSGKYVEGPLRKLAFVENMFREDMTAIEFAESVQALGNDSETEGKELTQGALGKLLGLKRTTVSGILSVAKMPADLKDMVRNNPNVTRDSLERISRIRGKARQEKAINDLLKELAEKGKKAQDAPKGQRESKRTRGQMIADGLGAYAKELNNRFTDTEFAVKYSSEDRAQIAFSLRGMQEKIAETIAVMEQKKEEWDKQYAEKKTKPQKGKKKRKAKSDKKSK
jgi:ParB/RepB/Spo0J family partition protein